MRGPSFWTPAEADYLGVFSSQLNQCTFCVRVHTEVVGIASRGEIDAAHPDSARPQLLAVLPLLERASRHPGEVTAADAEAARAVGLPDDAIIDALHVSLIFNTINRVVHAFGLAWDSEQHTRLSARVLHQISYGLPRFLTN